jgi:hypothetical protein
MLPKVTSFCLVLFLSCLLTRSECQDSKLPTTMLDFFPEFNSSRFLNAWKESKERDEFLFRGNSFRINVPETAGEELKKWLATSKAPKELLEVPKEQAREVATLSLLQILDTAYYQALRVSAGGSLPKAFAEIRAGRLKQVGFGQPQIASAIAQLECGIIPCDEKVCGPDCSGKLFKMLQTENLH